MILEVVTMTVKPELMSQFEAVFPQAAALPASSPGYISHELQRCVETKGRYLYMIRWETIEAHVVTYRQSPKREQFHKLVHEFFAMPVSLQHFEPVTDDRI